MRQSFEKAESSTDTQESENVYLHAGSSTTPLDAVEIERAVRERTVGRVRDVRVEVGDDGVLLTGLSSSFYGKQLAQHAVMELIGTTPLFNEIVVE